MSLPHDAGDGVAGTPAGLPDSSADHTSLDVPAAGFNGLDTDFIRVLEDLIDTLIEQGVLRLTDLPAEAQRKLLARKGLRNRLRNSLDLIGQDDVI